MERVDDRPERAAEPVRPAVEAVALAARAFALAMEQYTAGVAATHGIDPRALVALGLVLERSRAGLSTGPADLRRALGLSSPATTALVDRLVASGHLRRGAHPADRRRRVLELERRGHDDGESMFLPLVRRLGDRLRDVGDEDLELVAHALRSMAGAAMP